MIDKKIKDILNSILKDLLSYKRRYREKNIVLIIIVNIKYTENLIDNSKKLDNDHINKITRQVILNMTSKYREEIECESLKIKKCYLIY